MLRALWVERVHWGGAVRRRGIKLRYNGFKNLLVQSPPDQQHTLA